MGPRSSSRSTEVVVGHVRAPHGVKGEVRVEPLTDRFEERFRAGAVLRSVAGLVTIDAVRGTAADPIVHFAGIDDRAAAERLRGDLTVSREDARREGEHLWDDLIGLRVVTPEGVPLGEVRDVIRAGGADVLVVAGEREVLLPMIGSVIRSIASDGIVAVPQEEA